MPLLTPVGGRFRGLTDFIFTTGLSPAAQAYALARFAVQEKGVKVAAILLDERREEARALAEAFEQEFQKAFVEKYPKEPYLRPATITFGKNSKFADLKPALAAPKVELVLFAGSSKDYETWRQEAASGAYLVFYAGDDGPLKAAGQQDVYRATAFALDKDIPATLDFATSLNRHSRKSPTCMRRWRMMESV